MTNIFIPELQLLCRIDTLSTGSLHQSPNNKESYRILVMEHHCKHWMQTAILPERYVFIVFNAFSPSNHQPQKKGVSLLEDDSPYALFEMSPPIVAQSHNKSNIKFICQSQSKYCLILNGNYKIIIVPVFSHNLFQQNYLDAV